MARKGIAGSCSCLLRAKSQLSVLCDLTNAMTFKHMSLPLYRGGTKSWTDGQILEIYNAMLLGDSALAYAGNIAYLRLGPYLAAVDTDAPYNRRLLEMHEAV